MKRSMKAHSEGVCQRGRASPSPPPPPPPPPSRTLKYFDLDLQQPLWGPRVLVLFDVRRLSEHVVSA